MDDSDTGDETQEAPNGKYWIAAFVSAVLLAISGFAILLNVLHAKSLLVPPPLVATTCIDSKLAFLREQPLDEIKLTTVGSSVTWRNLMMEPFQENDRLAINAAPCFLYMSETAFYSEVILDVMPNVDTLISVVAPRDFNTCAPESAEFMNPFLAKLYLRRQVPKWTPYVANAKISYILTEAAELTRRNGGNDPTGARRMDQYGVTLMEGRKDRRGGPNFDERCFAAVQTLSDLAESRDVQLVLVTIPPQPDWLRRFDADGQIYGEWTSKIEAQLSPKAIFIDGRELAFTDEDFADDSHFMPGSAPAFSAFVAEQLRQAEEAR